MNLQLKEYRELAFLRSALLEKRELLWQKTIVEPFGETLKSWKFDEVQEAKKDFDEDVNPNIEVGLCNILLNKLATLEEAAQKELGMIK